MVSCWMKKLYYHVVVNYSTISSNPLRILNTWGLKSQHHQMVWDTVLWHVIIVPMNAVGNSFLFICLLFIYFLRHLKLQREKLQLKLKTLKKDLNTGRLSRMLRLNVRWKSIETNFCYYGQIKFSKILFLVIILKYCLQMSENNSRSTIVDDTTYQ